MTDFAPYPTKGRDGVYRPSGSQATAFDVFGERVEESRPPSPVRIIEVTDEVRAADAAARAAREASHSREVTWRRPEPVAPRSYVLPAGRSNGKRRSTKSQSTPARKTEETVQQQVPENHQPSDDRSQEERALDECWQSLSLNDKIAVLGDVLEAAE